MVSAIRISGEQEVAVWFLNRAKVPRCGWVVDPELSLVPIDVSILSRVDHELIIKMEDHYENDGFFLSRDGTA